MPGPKHGTPRKSGNRDVIFGKDKEGNWLSKPRTKNKKQAKRLAARQAGYHDPTSYEVSNGLPLHKPGSQNRKK